MNEPQVKLSDGQDTREDVILIAHALWQEAVERGWEDEYRQIIANANVSATVPVVGHITATLGTSTRRENTGTMGELFGPLMVRNGAMHVSFAYVAETVGEPGSFECICPEENLAYKAKDIAVEQYPGLRGTLNIIHDQIEKATASCSSRDCRY